MCERMKAAKTLASKERSNAKMVLRCSSGTSSANRAELLQPHQLRLHTHGRKQRQGVSVRRGRRRPAGAAGDEQSRGRSRRAIDRLAHLMVSPKSSSTRQYSQ